MHDAAARVVLPKRADLICCFGLFQSLCLPEVMKFISQRYVGLLSQQCRCPNPLHARADRLQRGAHL